jgi:hydrogenase maturation factor
VEGTAIVAAEFGDLLLEKGMPASEIDACRYLESQVSIYPEARIAWTVDGVSALHDVTEGGIATALAELSQAGGRGMHIRIDALPVYSQTRRLGKLLGIDPLGLIGSGSLLICCHPEWCDHLVSTLEQSGIAVADIGVVTQDQPGIEATKNGLPAAWPTFEVDEITRLFA